MNSTIFNHIAMFGMLRYALLTHTHTHTHSYVYIMGAKRDWDFRISDLVKNPDGTDI